MNTSDIFSISGVKRVATSPFFIILVIGIVIRLVIAPFLEVEFDAEHWATIIRNIESGNGLYGLEGYHYTPVWGYIIGGFAFIQESLLNINVLGTLLPDAFIVETYTDMFRSSSFFTSMITSVAFNFWITIPLIISDILVGYLTYWLIKDMTGDKKKATFGFALCFLCPLLICSTSVSGMFDTFSALFVLLGVILLRKQNYFMVGVLLTFAVLTKFFPAYLFFIFIAYILIRKRDEGKPLIAVMTMVAGMAVAFLILMMPQIINGELMDSLFFITNRVGDSVNGLISNTALIVFAILIPVSALLARHMYRKNDPNPDDSLFFMILFMLTLVFMYPPTPQYLVLLIPFLAIAVAVKGKEPLMKSWILISIGATLFIFTSNFTLLLSTATFTDLISVDFVMGMIEWFQTPILFGQNPMTIMYIITGVLQQIGIISLLWYLIRDKIKLKKRPSDEMISDT